MSEEERRKAALRGASPGSASEVLGDARSRILNAPPPPSRAGIAQAADPNDTRDVLWINPETGEEEARTLPASVALAALQNGTVRDASSGENAQLFEAITRRSQVEYEDVTSGYSFMEGIGESALGGLTGGLDRLAWSEEERFRFSKWVDQNPWAAGFAEGFGFLLPALLTWGGSTTVSATGAVASRAATAALSRGALSTVSRKSLAAMTAAARYTPSGLAVRAAQKTGSTATQVAVLEGVYSALPAAFLAEMNEAETDFSRFGQNLAIYGGLGAFVPVALGAAKTAAGEVFPGAAEYLKRTKGDATSYAAEQRASTVPLTPEMQVKYRDTLLELVDKGDADGLRAFLTRVAATEGPTEAEAARKVLAAARDRLMGGPKAWFGKAGSDLRDPRGTESIAMVNDLSEKVLKPVIEGAAEARGFRRGVSSEAAVGVPAMAADPTTTLGQSIQLNTPQLRQSYADAMATQTQDLLDQLKRRKTGGLTDEAVLAELDAITGRFRPDVQSPTGGFIPDDVSSSAVAKRLDERAVIARVRDNALKGFDLGNAGGKAPTRKSFKVIDDELEFDKVRFIENTNEIIIPFKKAAERGMKRRDPLRGRFVEDGKGGGRWEIDLPAVASGRGRRGATGRKVTIKASSAALRNRAPAAEQVAEALKGVRFRGARSEPIAAKGRPGLAFEGGEALGSDSIKENAGSAAYATIDKLKRGVPLGRSAKISKELPASAVKRSQSQIEAWESFRDNPQVFGEAFQQDAAKAREAYDKIIAELGAAPNPAIQKFINGDNVELVEGVSKFLFGKGSEVPDAPKLLGWIGRVAAATADLAALRGTKTKGDGMKFMADAFKVLSKRRDQLETLEAVNKLSFKARRETTQETWQAAMGRAFLGIPGLAAQQMFPWQVRAFINAPSMRAISSMAGDKIFEQFGRFSVGAGTKVRERTARDVSYARIRQMEAAEVAGDTISANKFSTVEEVRRRIPAPPYVMGIVTGGRRLSDSWTDDPDGSERYRQLSEAVNEISGSPQAMLLGMGNLTESLYEADPTGELGGSYGDTVAQAYSYLAEVMPTGMEDPLTGETRAPALSECREWFTVADALCDPAILGEMVAVGMVRESAVHAIRAAYPDLYAQFSLAFMQEASSMGSALGYAQKLTLGIATGLDLDGTQTDAFIAAASSTSTHTPEQSAAVGQPAAMQAQGFAQAAARMPTKSLPSQDTLTPLQQIGVG